MRTYRTASMGGRKFGAEGHGVRKFVGGEGQARKKDNLTKGMEVMLNRSDMKAIVDPMERSKAMGSDMMKKMSSLQSATGKDSISLLKMIGEKA